MGMTRQYLEQLSESIGPRPVASDTERDGAEWVRTQFADYGLNTTVQDFDTIRSLSGAYLLYALMSLACVALMRVTRPWPVLSWLLWVIILGVAVLAWLDFSGRGSLSKAFPKGPSQNVIGRYVPLARPGEAPTKIVLVAHYDTDRSSPLTSEGLAAVGRLITKLAHGVIMLLPVFALVMTLPLVGPLKKRLGFLTAHHPWNWYALLILCIPVLLMLFDLLIARVTRRYSPGANNNASGVAAMLSVCEDLAETLNPTSVTTTSDSAGKFGTGTLGAVTATSGLQPVVTQPADFLEGGSDFDTTFDFGVAPSSRGSGASRSSRGAGAGAGLGAGAGAGAGAGSLGGSSAGGGLGSLTGSFSSASMSASASAGAGSGAGAGADDIPDGYTRGAYGSFDDYNARDTFADTRGGTGADTGTDTGGFNFGSGAAEEDQGASYEESLGGNLGGSVLGADIIGGASQDTSQFTDSFGAVSPGAGASGGADDEAGADAFAAYAAGVGAGEITRSSSKKKGLFGRRNKKEKELSFGDFDTSDQPSDWLGVDTGYDAREEGRKIGSWDNFPSGGDDFDDGFSWKGGAAEGDLIEDEEYAATQAARIRRRISETQSTGLGNKELWFVATSAHYVHSRGMRTFLEDYHEDLRGALIINLAALGSGDLYWSVSERAGKTYKSSARLTALARRVAREKNLHAKPYKKGALRSEAGWALAEGRKAVSIMRLTPAGVPFAAASSQDVARRLETEKIDEAVELVISLIQEL
ncbi:MAG: hypothetical protein FWD65_06000 [Coriobacteriia bacterium]|nr:hypothetical protein [Coriobacteriia bacterium]